MSRSFGKDIDLRIRWALVSLAMHSASRQECVSMAIQMVLQRLVRGPDQGHEAQALRAVDPRREHGQMGH